MRIGIDVGGTKIEGIVMDREGRELARRRVATPTATPGAAAGATTPGDGQSDGDTLYQAFLDVIVDLVGQLEQGLGMRCSVGVGTPGFLLPATGLILNSNLAALNGKAVDRDLSRALGRPVRVDNDANCFVLSEATDGAAARSRRPVPVVAERIDVVFGATLGTGVGGGIVIDGRVLNGAHGATGEWSHTTLPFLDPDERSPYACVCGHPACIESFISGRGLAGTYRILTGHDLDAPEVGRRAAAGDADANRAFDVYEGRLARALAGVINLLDPHVIVLGGGVSNNARIFTNVPRLWERFTAAQNLRTSLVRAQHGDASGVRGAAWLWPESPAPAETPAAPGG